MTRSRSKIIFILSSDHSGSTWIGYVLGSTATSAFLGEYYRAWNSAVRVPCTVCAARGRQECAVLPDIDACPAADAFSYAAQQTGRPVLVDNSKLVNWTAPFLADPRLDCRVIHVVRDPRGWFASARRRGRIHLPSALAFWCEQNRAFHDFTRALGPAGMTVCYDRLAAGSQRRLKPVFAFCGLDFTKAALRYWDIEHHGYAANGASDALMKAAGLASPPSHFATGDDAFYQSHSQRRFHDHRWHTALSPDEADAVQSDPDVRTLLSALGYRLTSTGVAELSRWSPFQLLAESIRRRRPGRLQPG